MSVATPEVRDPVPSDAPPFKKLTVWPSVVIDPVDDGLSVAVRTTCCPKVLVVGLAVSASVVAT